MRQRHDQTYHVPNNNINVGEGISYIVDQSGHVITVAAVTIGKLVNFAVKIAFKRDNGDDYDYDDN